MHTQQDLTVLYIPFGIVILISIGMLWYFRWLYNRYLELETSGRKAEATIEKRKLLNLRGNRVLRLDYSFQAATGEERQGRSDVAHTTENLRECEEGNAIVILYSDKASDMATYPAKYLPEAINRLRKLNKVAPLLLIGNALMFYYILFYVHRPIL